MYYNIVICDKCGCVCENVEHIEIKFKNPNMDYGLSLCSSCFKNFCGLKEEYTDAREKLKNASEFQIARHILGENK